jgi:hypothetical protein
MAGEVAEEGDSKMQSMMYNKRTNEGMRERLRAWLALVSCAASTCNRGFLGICAIHWLSLHVRESFALRAVTDVHE